MGQVSRFAPLSGLAFAVLFGSGSAIWALDQPARGAEGEEIVSFYGQTSTEILIGGTMSTVSMLFLVWFGAIVRERLIAAESSERGALPMVALAGTIITAAVGLGAETINMAGALSAEDGQLTKDTAQIYFDVSYALGAPSAGVGLAMVAVPIALISLRTGRFLRPWSAWLTLLVAVAMLTPAMLTAAFKALFAVVIFSLAALSIKLYREGAGFAAQWHGPG